MTRPGSYFIIRDVISVDQIEYALSESWVAALGASIDARPEASGQASFSWKGTNSTTLVQRFAESHNIFYLPERLLKPFGSDTAGVIRVRSTIHCLGSMRMSDFRVIFSILFFSILFVVISCEAASLNLVQTIHCCKAFQKTLCNTYKTDQCRRDPDAYPKDQQRPDRELRQAERLEMV